MTIGVQEEFLLVDPATRRTVDGAAAVLERAGSLPAGAAPRPELLATQVEFATGVRASLDELRAQLVAGRRAVTRNR